MPKPSLSEVFRWMWPRSHYCSIPLIFSSLTFTRIQGAFISLQNVSVHHFSVCIWVPKKCFSWIDDNADNDFFSPLLRSLFLDRRHCHSCGSTQHQRNGILPPIWANWCVTPSIHLDERQDVQSFGHSVHSVRKFWCNSTQRNNIERKWCWSIVCKGNCCREMIGKRAPRIKVMRKTEIRVIF